LKRSVLVFAAPRRLEIHEEELEPPGAGEVLVRTAFSAPSPGTELLLYRGEAPPGLETDATIDSLSAPLSYPLRYGYAATGQVSEIGPEVDPSWQGRAVFAFQPHVSAFVARPQDLIELPAALALGDATLLANLESAVSFAMDGRPVIGERVAVFGQELVGLLTTWVLARFPLARLVSIDRHASRRE
jgi:alcohol dehydrogenase